MVKEGRTMRQAAEAGNYYGLEIPGWASTYDPPACETPEEVLACFKHRFPGVLAPGQSVHVIRIIDPKIGARLIENAGTVTA